MPARLSARPRRRRYGGIAGGNRASFLPISIERYRCYRDGIDKAWVHTALRSVETDGTQVVDIKIYDLSERLAAELDGLAVRRIPLDIVQSSLSDGRLFYRAAWRASASAGLSGEDGPRVQAGRFRRCKRCWCGARHPAGSARPSLPRCLPATDCSAGAAHMDRLRGDPQDFRRLLGQFTATEALPCEGVVYLWGLDAPSIEGLSLARLKSASEMMCRGALAVLHAVVETRSKHPAGRLWFVTANTQCPKGHRQVDPVQAPLWGLGRTVAIEYPGLWGGLIDFQLRDRGFGIDLLAAELLDPDGENQIVPSPQGHRYVPRFVEQSFAALPPRLPAVRGDATYLVTGGLGMLGHSVAKWLIGKGAKHLVLTGRHARFRMSQDIRSACRDERSCHPRRAGRHWPRRGREAAPPDD